MSSSSFPSISSLLNNSPTKPYQQLPSHSEIHAKEEQRSPGPASTLMSIPSVHQPGTPRLTFREPVEPTVSVESSPSSIAASAIITPNIPLTALIYFQLLSEISLDDTDMNLQQPPDIYFGDDPFDMDAPNVEGNLPTQSLPHPVSSSQFLLASSQFTFIASLVKICTSAALKHYHSLLPPPSVYINVEQNLPQLPFSTTIKLHPQETPQTALLCAEAAEVARAVDANLSLTGVLDLISHATRGGDSASPPEQLLCESRHAARMAPLWELANGLLDKLSRVAQGATLHPLILNSTRHAAEAFCRKLDDEEAMRHVRSVIPDLCLDVMLANGEWI
ncbi:hypothetical protein EPUS_04866 [Endocarpon pusillum Z07020]|uniref:Uncharacterized protein n=1 Tax=Endocarpon pusillum (strain Z07020 / HMAS-L-300199) TaxID=1263415 RepID=U1HZT5_ENDPU|nr:uncharacterized protein EPUS_04866 [Endocarpon pusillum Z07020]ERF75084.1 hypothetical protein EPUS_04866 [Endocarpon pusillum Z07020]